MIWFHYFETILFRVNHYMFDNKCSTMATGNGTSHVVAPSSIHIVLNQFQKEPHHCKFEDCQNHRRGYNDFCREHKAIGKIVSGKIARENAIAKIAARDKTNQVTEVNFTGTQYGPNQRKKRSFLEELVIYSMFEFSIYIIFFILFFPFLV